MALNSYVARLSSSQVANIAVDNHIEFDIDDGGSSIVTLSAGFGQAQGLFTVQRTGLYLINYSVRMGITNDVAKLELRDHPGTSQLLDIAGFPLTTFISDDATTNECETTNNSSIFSLTVGQIIKIAWAVVGSPVNLTQQFTAFSILEVG